MPKEHGTFIYNKQTNVEGFWIRRLHTLMMGGNGAALVLLGSFIGKTDNPIPELQENIFYFVPFVVGIIFTALAAFVGVTIDETILQKAEMEKIDPKEHETDSISFEQTLAYDFRHVRNKITFRSGVVKILLILSALVFFLGLLNLGFR